MSQDNMFLDQNITDYYGAHICLVPIMASYIISLNPSKKVLLIRTVSIEQSNLFTHIQGNKP